MKPILFGGIFRRLPNIGKRHEKGKERYLRTSILFPENGQKRIRYGARKKRGKRTWYDPKPEEENIFLIYNLPPPWNQVIQIRILFEVPLASQTVGIVLLNSMIGR